MPTDHPPSCACPAHPFHASMPVRDALAAYLAENGFTTEGYDAPTAEGALFGVKVRVPNPPSHRRAIRFHDLQHVATGYGTDHAGEAELAAWQARRGLGGAGAYVAGIVLLNVAVGFVVSPARVVTAFRSAGGGGSLFTLGADYEALLDGTVGALRHLLQLPAEGLQRAPRGFHAAAPGQR